MLKGKIKFPDRLGSFVTGPEGEEIVGSDPVFESGEELETFRPNVGFHDAKEDGGESGPQAKPDQKDSASKAIAVDEKRSNLEYEVRNKLRLIGKNI